MKWISCWNGCLGYQNLNQTFILKKKNVRVYTIHNTSFTFAHNYLPLNYTSTNSRSMRLSKLACCFQLYYSQGAISGNDIHLLKHSLTINFNNDDIYWAASTFKIVLYIFSFNPFNNSEKQILWSPKPWRKGKSEKVANPPKVIQLHTRFKHRMLWL